MDKQSQTKAIAEACGWVFTDLGNPRVYQCWTNPKGQRRSHLPKYISDLNAMHEAEKVLTCPQWEGYIEKLGNIESGNRFHLPSMTFAITATAAQRAEAFLKTLNLWT